MDPATAPIVTSGSLREGRDAVNEELEGDEARVSRTCGPTTYAADQRFGRG